ncbi:MAG: response regulator [Bacteroidota bacterium]
MLGNQYSAENSTFMYEENAQYDNFNKILLIEDNPGDARLVELYLGESDLLSCRITNKVTLSEGMQALAEEGDYAAVLLDLTLPDSRGFETLDRLLEKFPDTNVIVLTGHSDKSMGIKAVQAGAQDFLVKGEFTTDLLAKSLRYSIERSTVLKRLEESQRIAHIGNWEFDPNSKKFTASDEVFRIFGLAPRKMLITEEMLQDPDSPVYIFSEIHEETLANKGVKKDIELRQPDGQALYAFVQCSINKNLTGRLVLNGIIQDITERKKAEAEMIRSQERYQDIFTKSKDAIYICDLAGKLVDFNAATAELFGYEVEELRAVENIHDLFRQHGQEVPFLQQLADSKAVQDVELEIVRPSGKTRYCLLTASTSDKEGESLYNGILRDITERKQAEELRKARDVARQSAKMKEQFIASISHEMRTPMNAILGMSNLLVKTTLEKEQFGYVSSIKQSSEILLGVINDILEISTLENGKINFEYKHFHLRELMNNLMNVMQYKKKEKDLNFVLEIAEDVPQVIIGDKLRLNQVLYNLVGNAVKFTDKGFVRVSLEAKREDDKHMRLFFRVQDSGIGIPKDKLKAIFDTFTRIRTKDRIYEGTGLGLSIAKSLVEQQNGNVHAESELGSGSTFFFDMVFETSTLDMLEEQEKAKETQEETLDPDRVVRLLLVEDHKMNQIVARKTLERQYGEKIEITIADNGKKAVDILAEKLFDIILMDIQMPIMDGYETTQHIREKMPAEVARIPILAMTAHAHISKDEKFKEFGMNDYVLKPFEPKQLFSKIVKYVNRSNDHNE